MTHAVLIAALATAFAQNLLAAEAPPLDCPHCGTWTVHQASPPGSTGERIVASADRISLPTCGEFSVSVKAQKASIAGEHRTYRSTLELKPIQPDSPCGIAPGGTLRLEAVVSVGYRADGGLGEFTVYNDRGPSPVLSVTAWNYERDNPCDAGSGDGSAACMQKATASLVKTLSYEAYEARAGRQFNPARFAATTMDFCSEREADSGYGSWPYVWALSCQAGLLQTKLAELRSWAACQAASTPSSCKSLNENFERSPSRAP
jgi:hypothetical protein